MGRLTLNVLLSFAQFEREVTAERIRDKIAASKKKGLWMGGISPLGYDPHPDPNTRELVVNGPEAARVKTLFELYLKHGSLNLVEQQAIKLGLRSKRHLFKTGRTQGGNPLSRGQIHKILLNPVYLGKIKHKDKMWPGKHPAIIEQPLWDSVQARLEKASARPRGRTSGQSSNDQPVLLGKLTDDADDHLTPSHSIKNSRRHRYYISNRLISGGPIPKDGDYRPLNWRPRSPRPLPSIWLAQIPHLRCLKRPISGRIRKPLTTVKDSSIICANQITRS
jgi:hypothetical protein